MSAPYDDPKNDFEVPESFIGQRCLVAIALPMPQQARGIGGGMQIGMPEYPVMLLKDMKGSILVALDDGTQRCIPKNRIWSVECKQPKKPLDLVPAP